MINRTTSIISILACLSSLVTVSSAIGCYVCQSLNGDNPFCEDPFNTTSVDYFQPDCKSGRKGRAGLFLADACVKISGKYLDKPLETMLVRTCSADSDTLTTDTEISRVPKACGVFDFADNATSWDQRPTAQKKEDKLRRLRGCINACSNIDGCNDGTQLMPRMVNSLEQLLLLVLLVGFCSIV